MKQKLLLFVFRAAQKLSLSRRKKSQSGPASSPAEAPGPLLYTGGFSGALQLSPPAIPPCLLRAGSKVKDKPGMGKVRSLPRMPWVQTVFVSLWFFFLLHFISSKLTLCHEAANLRDANMLTPTQRPVCEPERQQKQSKLSGEPEPVNRTSATGTLTVFSTSCDWMNFLIITGWNNNLTMSVEPTCWIFRDSLQFVSSSLTITSRLQTDLWSQPASPRVYTFIFS